MILSTIPFSGFYESAHDSEFDREIEFALEGIESDSLVNLAYDSADFGAARLEYAREYAESFLQWLSLDGKLESLSSPRFYNFETDRIFVELTRSDVARLWRMVPRDVLDSKCRDRFTSCSGFISHYSNDWRDWGPLSSWDHNQIGTLVACAADVEQDSDFDMWSEYELMESYLCNGGPHGAMWQGERADRFWRIVNYLHDRRDRPIKTMEQWHAARRAEMRPFQDTPLGQWRKRA